MLFQMSLREKLGYAGVIALLLFAFGYAGAQHLRKPAPIVFREAGQSMRNDVILPVQITTVKVHVVGSVMKPGVYDLMEGQRVEDAIEKAGGPAAEADLDALNLAAKLVDGSQLRVPATEKSAVAAPKKSASKSVAPARVEIEGDLTPQVYKAAPEPTYSAQSESSYVKVPEKSSVKEPDATKAQEVVNINTASASELEKLPGVGPATAAKIVEYRTTKGPFTTVEELLAIKGIGAKKLEQIRAHVKL